MREWGGSEGRKLYLYSWTPGGSVLSLPSTLEDSWVQIAVLMADRGYSPGGQLGVRKASMLSGSSGRDLVSPSQYSLSQHLGVLSSLTQPQGFSFFRRQLFGNRNKKESKLNFKDIQMARFSKPTLQVQTNCNNKFQRLFHSPLQSLTKCLKVLEISCTMWIYWTLKNFTFRSS